MATTFPVRGGPGGGLGSVTLTGSPTSGQVPVASSPTEAVWGTPSFTSTGVPGWAPATVYSLGQRAISPDGNVITAQQAHMSGATFDSTLWFYPTDDGSTIVDCTQLPDGNASTIRPTKGHIKNRSNIAAPNDLVVSGGLMYTINTHPNFYFELGLVNNREPVQHMWCIFDVDPNPPTNTGITLLFLSRDQSLGIQAGIHWGLLLNTGGSFNGLWASGPYPGGLGGISDGPSVTNFQQPRGRTMRLDITVDRRTGLMTGYIDGLVRIQYTDIDVLAYIRHTAAFQFPGGWIKMREMGISPRLPLFAINGTNRVTSGNTDNFGTGLTTLTTTYQLVNSTVVEYGSGGMVEVYMPMMMQVSSGSIEVTLGTSTVAADQDGVYADKWLTGNAEARIMFSRIRTGTPGTRETVGIWARVTAGGTASLRNNTYGNNAGGPRWRAMQPHATS